MQNNYPWQYAYTDTDNMAVLMDGDTSATFPSLSAFSKIKVPASFTDAYINEGLSITHYVRKTDTTGIPAQFIITSSDGVKFVLSAQDDVIDASLSRFGLDFTGATDSKVKLQDLLNYAKTQNAKLVLPKDGKLALSDTVYLANGLRELDGNGTTLMMTKGGIYSYTYGEGGNALPVNNLVIRNLIIRPVEGATKVHGIILQDPSNTMVTNCDVHTVNDHGIIAVSTTKSKSNMFNVKLIANRAKFLSGTDAKYGIATFSQSTKGEIDVDYRDTGICECSKSFAVNFVFTDNIVEGFRYAIAHFYTKGHYTARNFTSGGVRGVVHQRYVMDGITEGNQCTETSSATCLLSYHCSGNIIRNNTFSSNVQVKGQATVQINVGCNNNLIEGNRLRINPPIEGLSWFVYIGCDCSGNIIQKNDMKGKVARGGIVVESGWTAKTEITNVWSYSQNFATTDAAYSMSRYHTMRNIIRENTIEMLNDRAVFAFSAADDKNGTHNLIGLEITGNIVKSKHATYLEGVQKGNSKVTYVVFRDNVFPAGTTAAKFKYDAAMMQQDITFTTA